QGGEGRSSGRPRGDVREGGAGKTRRLAERCEPHRCRRECPRCAAFGGTRRSAARHRLCDGCRDRTARPDYRDLPARHARTDRLSNRADGLFRKSQCSRSAGLSARRRRASAISEGGVHRARRGAVSWVLAFSPEELTAIRLSLRVAFWAMLGSLPCGIAFALWLSLDAIDRRLEDAAGTLGANAMWIFVPITLPLILPGILAGMILSFARALGEFGATITFDSNIPGETQTLPTAIYMLIQVPGGDLAALRLTLVSIAISMLALFASEALIDRASRRVQGR